MKLIHYNKTNQWGINAVASKATRKHISLANEMVKTMDESEEEWQKKLDLRAWALAHGQLDDSIPPLRIFVVHKDLLAVGQNPLNTRFPSRTIFNPRILKSKPKADKKRNVLKTVLNPETGRREVKEVVEYVAVPNTISSKEGCMSFPHKKEKNVERFFRIKVRYYYPVTVLGFTFLRPKTEWVEGLKSVIFQHELEHFESGNIYYGKSVR